MIKGSHNSFTFMRPLQWWLRPFASVARCQKYDLEEQYRRGVRCFDLRIRRGKEGLLEVAHNRFIYVRGWDNFYEMMDRLYVLSDKGRDISIRVLHEVRNEEQRRYSTENMFARDCLLMQRLFPNIRFFGGQNLIDWRWDYVFNTNVSYIECHASVRWPKWLHWWPWLYAKLYNGHVKREYIDKETEQPCTVLYDFCD